MGKPYASELTKLYETYGWASSLDISFLRQAILKAWSLPVLAIGSGGSLTAAHFLASIHRRFTGKLATVATPLDAISDCLDRHVSVWLLSASGGNVDILTAFKTLVSREPAQLSVMCGRLNNPLSSKARQHDYVDVIDFAVPTGKDGFLATNSLLAFCVLIVRAYAEVFNRDETKVANLVPKSGQVGLDEEVLLQWQKNTSQLWGKKTTVVLHGTGTKIGAIDLESKFTEAGIGNLQVADYRNFAHGRHHWLDKQGKSSGILAFTTPEDRDLAVKTLDLIPKEIPIARIDLNGDRLTTSLASLVAALHITGWAGKVRGIDPGRPGVPEFGRRLYHLTLPRKKDLRNTLPAAETIAIERKTGVPISQLIERGDFDFWRSALVTFKKSLAATKFSAVVFDYDGTLVDTRERFDPPGKEIVEELCRLIEGGIIIGIATGRGASIRQDLQACLPRSFWGNVIIGYYNGADIAFLEEDNRPDGTKKAGLEIAHVARLLLSQPELTEIAKQENRKKQITLEPQQAVPEDRLWDIANQVIQGECFKDICIVRSSHSIDILAPGVSKLNVINFVREATAQLNNVAILKIGDRGRWPGNDFLLLREPFSLSVDELSVDPSTCWNLSPIGQRGTKATLDYCRALHIESEGVARIILKSGKRSI